MSTRKFKGLPLVACAGLIFMGLFPQAEARPVQQWLPDQLTDKAQIVCNGIPVKVTITDQKGQIQLLTNAPDPIRIVSATIKVLGTIKGHVNPEIEIHYPNLDDEALRAKGINGVINGPQQIYLQTGQRYRFYLNPVPGHTWYVGALNGEFDDGFAVQELGAKESDADTPLLKDEAVKIATDYLLRQHPWFGQEFKAVLPKNFSASRPLQWTVVFYPKVPKVYPDWTSGAEIVINADRSIDADSWISARPPVTVPNPSMLNQVVRVTYMVHATAIQRPDGTTFYTGEMKVARGTLEKIEKGTITVHLTKPDDRYKLDRDVIFIQDIKSIDLLL